MRPSRDASHLLAGVPPAQLDESPSSWLTRAALSQGTTTVQVLQHLSLRQTLEVDFFVHSPSMANALSAAGLPATTLLVASKMLANLRTVDRFGRTFLLRDKQKARYRYCAACLHMQPNKYLPLHWRFKAWQWCPQHMSYMRDVCTRCHSPIELPGNLSRSGAHGEGVASLDCCLMCGHRLSASADSDRNQIDPHALDEWTATLLRNGRALVSAFYYGHMCLMEGGKKRKLSQLRYVRMLTPNDLSISPREEFLSAHPE